MPPRSEVGLHAAGEFDAVYTTAPIIVSRDCVSCGDLSLSRAGRQALVLSSTRAALMAAVEEGT